jgi:hypothetical protein
VPTQACHLTEAQPAVRANRDERSISLIDRLTELSDLGRLEEARTTLNATLT